MKNIKDNFIPYEEAKELKELGFDEECFGRYSHSQSSLIYAGLTPLNHNLNQSFGRRTFDTFEEAQLETLRKLIELIKNTKI